MPTYLDHHATTPCDPAVLSAMIPHFSELAANASSRSHRAGLRAREAVEEARSRVAGFVGCEAREVVFTSGATESDNLALLGLVRAGPKRHVVTVATEHKAVLDTVAAVVREGGSATVLPVDSRGRVDPDDLGRALRPDTAVVSAMLVNNEVGVVHDLPALAARCRAAGVPLHCDAAQALATPIPWESLDLVSLSAHKIHGPQGVGALAVRRTRPPLELASLQHGGSQERGVRPGTLPVALCVGMGVAASLPSVSTSIRALRDRLWAGLVAAVDGLELNGPELADRAANNLNFSVDGVEAAALLMAVRDHLALSTGSACSSETLRPSHVLLALGLAPERAHRAIRIGLGRTTTGADVDLAVDRLAEAVRRIRRLSG